MKKIQIIYENNKPHGIRNQDGFLFFFPNISKYHLQEERYRIEIESQVKLADYLSDCLKKYELTDYADATDNSESTKC
jgi:hypothetical protein